MLAPLGPSCLVLLLEFADDSDPSGWSFSVSLLPMASCWKYLADSIAGGKVPGPKGFYTDEQGRTRPIFGESSGKAAGFVVAATTAVVVASSGGVAGGGSASGSMASGVLDSPAAAKEIKGRVNNAKSKASKGNRSQTWQRMRLRQAKREVRRDVRCSVRSFGQVRSFFVRSPCRSLQRAVLALDDGRGNSYLLSIAWVRMSSSRQAADLKKLDDRHGTGDVAAPADLVLKSRGVEFTGRHYESRRKGGLFVRAEAVPLRGHPSSAALDGVPVVAVELPPP